MGGMSLLASIEEVEYEELRAQVDRAVDVAEIVGGWLPDDPFVLVGVIDAARDRLSDGLEGAAEEKSAQQVAREAERLGSRMHAVQIDAMAAVERTGHERHLGFRSARAWSRHRHKLSRPTALGRSQTVRLFELLPRWAAAARAGEVGVDQTVLMARVAANPRLQEALPAQADELLDDARFLSYDEFEKRLRTWVALADPIGDAERAERARQRRGARMRFDRDRGVWSLTARFGAVDGAEFNEIMSYFGEAEFQVDLAVGRAANDGEMPDAADLARSEHQRQADALLNMARSAASAPNGSKVPLPTLNVLMDAQTLQTLLEGDRPSPADYRAVTCRTQRGDPMPLDEAAAMTLWAHIRRVVTGAPAVVIDLGRRSRLFTGSSREATMLLHETCLWAGCDRPARPCETDHCIDWEAHGATVPRNGVPLCKFHNLFKYRNGFTARFHPEQGWRICTPSGKTI